ncbi:cache domain-containing sensor histidine kinase [Paenibacillus cymbidii]|uniref:cache domain-containing sensor histidine kinase n=1 Tax=Paenibacillus cymbidii TaxID=1639034 RepID=UPI001436839E|nr:sensor histidine kinase [Paenibacillus cymbidii]
MFRFRRLQTRMLLYFLCLVLIPLIGLGTYAYDMTTRSLEKQTERHQAQTIRLIADNLKSILGDADGITSYIVSNESVQDLLSQKVPDVYFYGPIFDYVNKLKETKTYISFVLIYGENGLIYRDFAENYREIKLYPDIKTTALYSQIAARSGDAVLSMTSAPVFRAEQQDSEPMVARSIMGTFNSQLNLGSIFMGIRKETLQSLINDIYIAEKTNLVLLGEGGSLMASRADDPAFSRTLERDVELRGQLAASGATSMRTIDGRRYLVAGSRIEPYGWTAVSLTPLTSIRQQYGELLQTTIVLSTLLLLVVGLISFFLSRSVTQPIQKLLRSMNNFKRGDFNQKVEIASYDEIGLLGQKYNHMVAELNQLIQKVYIAQTNQKIIELRTLQAQIEPHFLYNTLDFIFLNSKMNGDHTTAQVVQSLSRLFRISLNRGKDYYTVREELEQIKAYILIQHARFPNRFTPEYSIDPETAPFLTMKLILQPIVENSIIHAFEALAEQPYVLELEVRKEGDDIAFAVHDNGSGMTEEQTRQLLHPAPHDDKRGYGIHNVSERLQMLFGPRYALRIDSKPGGGTTVRFRIPQITGEKEWAQLYESDGYR